MIQDRTSAQREDIKPSLEGVQDGEFKTRVQLRKSGKAFWRSQHRRFFFLNIHESIHFSNITLAIRVQDVIIFHLSCGPFPLALWSPFSPPPPKPLLTPQPRCSFQTITHVCQPHLLLKMYWQFLIAQIKQMLKSLLWGIIWDTQGSK